MKSPVHSYGKLCGLFYDATETFASEHEVNFYASFIPSCGSRTLEAMSGSGRLQIPLLTRGYLVDGVDRSSAMLDRCRSRCADLKLAPNLYEQSLENLDLPCNYSTVTIAIGSFQLIADRFVAEQALKKIHTHMSQGGNLLIDIFVPACTQGTRSTRVARIDENTEVRLATRYQFDEHARIIDAFCSYDLVVDGMVRHQENELVQATWYTDEELTQLLAAAGFEVVAFYDESFRSAGPSRVVHAKKILAAL